MSTTSMDQSMSSVTSVPGIRELFISFQHAFKAWSTARRVARNSPYSAKAHRQAKRWQKEVDHAVKYGKRYTSAEEMHDDILGKR